MTTAAARRRTRHPPRWRRRSRRRRRSASRSRSTERLVGRSPGHGGAHLRVGHRRQRLRRQGADRSSPRRTRRRAVHRSPPGHRCRRCHGHGHDGRDGEGRAARPPGDGHDTLESEAEQGDKVTVVVTVKNTGAGPAAARARSSKTAARRSECWTRRCSLRVLDGSASWGPPRRQGRPQPAGDGRQCQRPCRVQRDEQRRDLAVTVKGNKVKNGSFEQPSSTGSSRRLVGPEHPGRPGHVERRRLGRIEERVDDGIRRQRRAPRAADLDE